MSSNLRGMKWVLPVMSVLLAVMFAACAESAGREGGTVREAEVPPRHEVATLGGGCFWCLDAVYREIVGVERVVSGFSGGTVKNPSYRQVMTGRTGHAEVVQITFDPDVTTYRELLEIYFSIHDPTTVDRQGPDVGPQYRSIVLYHSASQRALVEEIIAEMTARRVYADPIVTEVRPFAAFYPAEEYHQNYYARNPEQAYCRVVIAPKLKEFRQTYRDKLRK